ncbi:flavin reductase family protein [Caballeronia sp. LZ029]|uniref:flavin reductase family protein n=1 Tax=unclassified Caballeronia TaxID=2646786 RepID=UPI002854F6C3|nr:flavin reductase family protein [Caballeronia sp. LZ029]MDR5744815.1 flavin reductase family protein [Caballeronia sp. LZ029]
MKDSIVRPGSDPETQRQFRSALSMFATGVAVITAPRDEGAPIGMTVASFNSVSLDPPLILFSVDRRSLSLADLCVANSYAVNVLEESQQDMSNRFAKANGDKWGWRDAATNPCREPVLLPDTLATFECEPYAQYDGGDHVIFVGRVIRHRTRSQGRPLIFFGGRYHTLNGVQAASA